MLLLDLGLGLLLLRQPVCRDIVDSATLGERRRGGRRGSRGHRSLATAGRVRYGRRRPTAPQAQAQSAFESASDVGTLEAHAAQERIYIHHFQAFQLLVHVPAPASAARRRRRARNSARPPEQPAARPSASAVAAPGCRARPATPAPAPTAPAATGRPARWWRPGGGGEQPRRGRPTAIFAASAPSPPRLRAVAAPSPIAPPPARLRRKARQRSAWRRLLRHVDRVRHPSFARSAQAAAIHSPYGQSRLEALRPAHVTDNATPCTSAYDRRRRRPLRRAARRALASLSHPVLGRACDHRGEALAQARACYSPQHHSTSLQQRPPLWHGAA